MTEDTKRKLELARYIHDKVFKDLIVSQKCGRRLTEDQIVNRLYVHLRESEKDLCLELSSVIPTDHTNI